MCLVLCVAGCPIVMLGINSSQKAMMFIFFNKFSKFLQIIHSWVGGIAMPFQVCSHPKYFPVIFSFYKCCLCKRMFKNYLWLIPLWSDFKNNDALVFNFISNVQCPIGFLNVLAVFFLK